MTLRADVRVRRGALDLAVDLGVAAGEVVVVVGPNGAGKSTLLQAVAGLVPLLAGRVECGGRVLDEPARGRHVPVPQRRVGHVFADHLLFPHLDVLDNVAFGLRAAGLPRARARDAARPWLARLDLTGLADRRAARLSGGQQQRVALARALAAGPDALLLDEPLAALDAGTRLLVRTELRHHLAEVGVPTVVVTHDPVDALVLGDRVVVLEGGRVVQAGAPRDVARAPRTDYVARLVGLNRWEGVASGHRVRLPGGREVTVTGAPHGPVLLTFAPSAVVLFGARPPATSVRNVWQADVRGLEPRADTVRVQLLADDGTEATAEVTALAAADLGLAPGRRVWVGLKATEVAVHPA
ncbi:ABC transporter ATP-binding protein [Aquipuribacter sp. SD81]|uniref:ABC transporter ATP-binding protein n=1 Tax=Aquipuribacter sp. SD81 TaxID=3127703 RepID=UPI003016D368